MSRPPFADNLRAKMKMHGINQPELARRVRVKTSTVNRWLKGRVPGGLDLLALARVLEIDPYLLAGSDYVEPLAPLLEQEAPRVGRPPKQKGFDVDAFNRAMKEGGGPANEPLDAAAAPVRTSRKPS